MIQFSQEQVAQLAPDAASAKAGLQLATSAKWQLKAFNEKSIWGECQGSGKNPYKTFIDMTNIAFQCSCPSRKFPCKHGLGLLFLFSKQASVFSTTENPPKELEDWLNKRVDNLEKKERTEEKPIDEVAQQKRKDSRERKVLAGIEELRFWLKDLSRTGIMSIPQNQYNFNKNIIARMIDAQASGLAYQLKKLNWINYYEEGWQAQLTYQLSFIYLLAEAYLNKDNFDDLLKKDVMALIGWTTTKEEVLKGDAIHDFWHVLSKENELDGNLITERVWLYGENTKKFALILNFFHSHQSSEILFNSGAMSECELVYYPSVYPLRALIKKQIALKKSALQYEGIQTSEDIYNYIAERLSLFPFVEKLPLFFTNFKLNAQDKLFFIKDKNNQAFQLNNKPQEFWTILSITQGRIFSGFAIFEQDKLTIRAFWYNNEFYPIL
jgi:hypothetical protein